MTKQRVRAITHPLRANSCIYCANDKYVRFISLKYETVRSLLFQLHTILCSPDPHHQPFWSDKLALFQIYKRSICTPPRPHSLFRISRWPSLWTLNVCRFDQTRTTPKGPQMKSEKHGTSTNNAPILELFNSSLHQCLFLIRVLLPVCHSRESSSCHRFTHGGGGGWQPTHLRTLPCFTTEI